jgi:hypothetical protein
MRWFKGWYAYCKALWQRHSQRWLWRSKLAIDARIPTWQVGELCLWLQQLFLSQQLHALATQSHHVSGAAAAVTASDVRREGGEAQPFLPPFFATHYFENHFFESYAETAQLLQLTYCRLRLPCFSEVDIVAWVDAHQFANATVTGTSAALVVAAASEEVAAPMLWIGTPTWRQRRKAQLWQLDIVARTVAHGQEQHALAGRGPQIEFEFCLQRSSAQPWPSARGPVVRLRLDKAAFAAIGKAVVAS